MKIEPQGEGEDQCPSCPPLTSSGVGGQGVVQRQQEGFLGDTFEPSSKSLGENFGFTVWSLEFEWFSYNVPCNVGKVLTPLAHFPRGGLALGAL